MPLAHTKRGQAWHHKTARHNKAARHNKVQDKTGRSSSDSLVD
jgi:hypothetical protein